VQSATNGNAFPNTTPDKPYLTQYLIQDAPKVTTRRSFGIGLDFKLSPHDRVTFGTQYSSFDGRFIVANITFAINRVAPTDFSTSFTHGATGQGTLSSNHQERNRFNRTFMPTFTWRHDGPIWKMDTGVGLSQQSDYNRDIDQGFFRIVAMQRTNVTIAFDDIFYLRPRTITVRDGTTGAPIDPYSLSSYTLNTANTQANKTYDRQRTAYSSVRRDFHARVPFTLKAGVDFREAVRERRQHRVELPRPRRPRRHRRRKPGAVPRLDLFAAHDALRLRAAAGAEQSQDLGRLLGEPGALPSRRKHHVSQQGYELQALEGTRLGRIPSR
jgi:hypothetical protein